MNERRKAHRSNLAWPISVWSLAYERFYNGKLINISTTGVLVALPVTCPIKKGQDVEINIPRTKTLFKQKGQYARIKQGKIVRVDEEIIETSDYGFAIEFKEN